GLRAGRSPARPPLTRIPLPAAPTRADRYVGPDGQLRIALSKQPFLPNGRSPGPDTMANGGIRDFLARLHATVRIDEARLTADEDKEYGGWESPGLAVGHLAHMVEKKKREGVFTAGVLGARPPTPGL